MIVRIATEGQYELTERDAEVFSELDGRAVAACEARDEEHFQAVFNELLEFVRRNGAAVGEDHLAPSDLILPPPDVSMEEASREFHGEGLIPG